MDPFFRCHVGRVVFFEYIGGIYRIFIFFLSVSNVIFLCLGYGAGDLFMIQEALLDGRVIRLGCSYTMCLVV